MSERYFRSLDPRQRAIYRASAAVTTVELGDSAQLQRAAGALRAALVTSVRAATEQQAQVLADVLTTRLGVPSVRVRVLEVRPSANWGELHGLYEHQPGRRPMVTIWMRTAKNERVVAFRTFLRTLVHEFGHHLDYTLLKLADSLHTPGFFKRESSMMRQILGRSNQSPATPPAPASDSRDRARGRATLAALRARLVRDGGRP